MDAALSLLRSDDRTAALVAGADPEVVEFMVRLTAWQSRQLVGGVFGDAPNLEPTVQRWEQHEREWAQEPLAGEAVLLRQALRAQAGSSMVLEKALLAYLEEVAAAQPGDHDVVVEAPISVVLAADVELVAA